MIDFSGWKPQKNPYSLVLLVLLLAAIVTIAAEFTPDKIMSLMLFKRL